MLGTRCPIGRVAGLVGVLCVGGALSLPPSAWAVEAAPPIFLPKPQDKEGKKKDEEEAKKKDGKKGNGTDGEIRTAPGVPLPPHLAGVPVLDLASCKAIALTKQPALAAAHASYQAACARQQALDTVRVPNFLARDLPVRKQQAAVGVTSSALEVQRIQMDTVYSVTYAFLTAQYAAEQRAMLEDARTRLMELKRDWPKAIAAEKRNVRKEQDMQRIEASLGILDSRREEAAQGEQRAMSALREAMGVDPHSPLVLRATGLYRLSPTLDKDQLVSLALARRPEVRQATLLSQVHALEIEAQGTRRLFPTAPTFASGSDIHARPLPAGSYDEAYRPAAVGPDMPVTINGCNAARAEVARAYHLRSGSMVDKTKALMALETEQAFFRFLEACRKLPHLQRALENATEVVDDTRRLLKDYKRDGGTVADLLGAGTQETELRAQINTARYQLLVALAGLERATACGYVPGFETAPTTDPPKPPRPRKDDGKKDDGKKKDDDEMLDAPKKGKDKDDVLGPSL